MARPLSEDKRDAILASAAELVAVLGTSAPTAKIAKGAGVAEGTLFTYFSDKDALLAALFLDIEGELAKAILGGAPAGADPQDRIRHMWDRFLDWGADNPARRKALKQLKVSDRIGAECRRCGEEMFADFRTVLDAALDGKTGEGLSADYVGALLSALAEITFEFIAREPERRDHYRTLGFKTFSKMLAT